MSAVFDQVTRSESEKNYFDKIDEQIKAAKRAGKAVFDLSIGEPDLPPPSQFWEELALGLNQDGACAYPALYGEDYLLNSIQDWYRVKYSTTLDRHEHVLPLLGVKEGIAHLALGILEKGEYGAYVTPGYPIYKQAIRMAGGIPIALHTMFDENYFPDLKKIGSRPVRLLYMNYPNNPTGTVLTKESAEQLVQWVRSHNIYLCLDRVYGRISKSEIFEDYSILSVPGAMDCCIEMHSFSKDYNLPGIRLGFAAGNSHLIQKLKQVKTLTDVSVFKPVQYAGARLLQADRNGELESYFEANNSCYSRRFRIISEILDTHRIKYFQGTGTFFVWFEIPSLFKDDHSFCSDLFERTGVLLVPGSEFEEETGRWCRLTLSKPDEMIMCCAAHLDDFLGGCNG
ncbi:pyridoxal phosphate-dependent aminotransferase [Paenibacillus sp. JSM ZJ436]|uniref:pyridoxal phosphate-dependent aminotransferase n=1 Tax=Paenibacillus sp. JSM ZJ436 TaxID=3376190 RepID=UPI0037ADFA27